MVSATEYEHSFSEDYGGETVFGVYEATLDELLFLFGRRGILRDFLDKNQ